MLNGRVEIPSHVTVSWDVQLIMHHCKLLVIKLFKFNKAHRVRLCQYILSDEEWVVLQQLHNLLDLFLFTMKDISTSGHVLVDQVIPYIDVLTSHVDNFKKDSVFLPAIRAAVQRGHVILDNYYSLCFALQDI
ncbi:hypothetical protein VTO73DRAFT_7197 [Trametes versicolor]